MKRINKVARVVGILSCLVNGLMFMGYEAPVASAQVLYGSIAGTVTDRTGSVVHKAVVKITSTTTGLSREATTDSAGYYSIQNIPQGDYELSHPKRRRRSHQ
jgi:Carboxypeptidase regulatory-like domain